jgi:hypothetical protein
MVVKVPPRLVVSSGQRKAGFGRITASENAADFGATPSGTPAGSVPRRTGSYLRERFMNAAVHGDELSFESIAPRGST